MFELAEVWKNLGFGLGLRTPYFSDALKNPKTVDWFEIISENFMGLGDRPAGKELNVAIEVRKNFPLVMHGVSLSIGSTDPIRHDYLNRLKTLAEILEPAWISDHVCWTGVDQVNVHDLLPLPYNKEAIDHITKRVLEIQTYLKRPIVLENVSSYHQFPESEMPEAEFLKLLHEKTGCGILLDLNNVYVNSVNHKFDPLQFITTIPTRSIAQIHLAGHSISNHAIPYLIDTHDQPVKEKVWSLYQATLQHHGFISTLIERDDNFPAFRELVEELDQARHIAINNSRPWTSPHV